jgi:RHS repeat-associated protein
VERAWRGAQGPRGKVASAGRQPRRGRGWRGLRPWDRAKAEKACLGDVTSANDSVNGNWTYGYDDFNRLVAASEPSAPRTPSYSYGYDRFGNRWNVELDETSPPLQQESPMTFSGDNKISSTRYRYDAAGNLQMDNANCYTYDAENRLVSTVPETLGGVCGSATDPNAMNYHYDPDGRRVAKIQNGSVVKQYYYDAAGQMIEEANASGAATRAEIYAGGRHLATWNNNATYFNHADWLGTERVRTKATDGSVCETITSLPFGDGQNISGNCGGGDSSPNHFTGLERDSESGLDHTLNRQYGSNFGRWLTPDPGGMKVVHLENPQSWNMYNYVLNNPLTLTDPLGLDPPQCTPGANTEHTNAETCAETQEENQKAANVSSYKGGQFVVVGGTTTTETTDERGNKIKTTKETVVRFNADTGEYVDNTQWTTTRVESPTGETSEHTVKSALPSEGAALKILGSEAVNSAIASTVPGRTTLFGRGIAQDAKAHPGRYVRAGVEIGAAVTPAGPYEVPKLILAGSHGMVCMPWVFRPC